MSVNIKNLTNDNKKIINEVGNFKTLEYQKDISTTEYNAQIEYFMSEMNVKKRQLLVELNGSNGVTVQSGAMQWMAGNIQPKTGIKSAGDLFSKMIKSTVTSESVVKPEYRGTGLLCLEPTYKHIILKDLSEWGGSLVVEDGLFLACDADIKQKVVARSNISSAVLGNEGLFNLCLQGNGVVALESDVPESELIEVTLDNDVIKIDGNMALCWSSSLQFTVERTTKTLVGSAASGEGFVNVYRGTGKILMTPVAASLYSRPVIDVSNK